MIQAPGKPFGLKFDVTNNYGEKAQMNLFIFQEHQSWDLEKKVL
jgi:hypothetical protein